MVVVVQEKEAIRQELSAARGQLSNRYVVVLTIPVVLYQYLLCSIDTYSALSRHVVLYAYM